MIKQRWQLAQSRERANPNYVKHPEYQRARRMYQKYYGTIVNCN